MATITENVKVLQYFLAFVRNIYSSFGGGPKGRRENHKIKKPSSQDLTPLKRRFLCLLSGGNSNLVTICYNSFCAFFVADQKYHRYTDQDQTGYHEESMIVTYEHLLTGH